MSKLNSEVPQGWILSPLLFIIFVANFPLWLKYAIATTYAEDTSTSISDKDLNKIIKMLEENAMSFLKNMASNGLVANAKKTTFLLLNLKNNTPIHF